MEHLKDFRNILRFKRLIKIESGDLNKVVSRVGPRIAKENTR